MLSGKSLSRGSIYLSIPRYVFSTGLPRSTLCANFPHRSHRGTQPRTDLLEPLSPPYSFLDETVFAVQMHHFPLLRASLACYTSSSVMIVSRYPLFSISLR